MEFDFSDQVVLVTGGSRGIGRVICVQFAKAGARVIVNYRTREEAARAVLESLGGRDHCTIQADLGDPPALASMVDEVVERYGRIDVLINNAGVWSTSRRGGLFAVSRMLRRMERARRG